MESDLVTMMRQLFQQSIEVKLPSIFVSMEKLDDSHIELFHNQVDSFMKLIINTF